MSGKVVLIAAASSGIGQATAELFAANGAKVALAARREDQLAALAGAIESRGGQATFVKTDVAVAKDVERMVAHTIATFAWWNHGPARGGMGSSAAVEVCR